MPEWTRAICKNCWDKRFPGRSPCLLTDDTPEVCCDCGEETTEGILIRVDPRLAKFPDNKKDG